MAGWRKIITFRTVEASMMLLSIMKPWILVGPFPDILSLTFLAQICRREIRNETINCLLNGIRQNELLNWDKLHMFGWTYRVLKFIRFNAPILRDEASVKSFECNNITRHIRYKRRNIGKDNATSYGTSSDPIALFLFANLVVHRK